MTGPSLSTNSVLSTANANEEHQRLEAIDARRDPAQQRRPDLRRGLLSALRVIDTEVAQPALNLVQRLVRLGRDVARLGRYAAEHEAEDQHPDGNQPEQHEERAADTRNPVALQPADRGSGDRAERRGTNIELMGDLAAIGIVKGKPFKPDKRMRGILEDAAAVGNAASRTLVFDARASEGFGYYDDGSAWGIPLWVGGYSFETPPPLVTQDGIEPLPATGARTLNARTSFFYAYTGITPAMCMRLTGVGSQYIVAFKDREGDPLDGAKSYRVKLPPDIPAARFWSLTAYDNQTRSMLQTPQRFPRAGSQAYPTPAATADDDGSTTVVFSPERPADTPEGNWIQTDPDKGWFAILRLYSPLQSYFDKSWRPSEMEPLG